jgi:putative membrane protein
MAQNAQPAPDDPRTQNSGALNTPQNKQQPGTKNPGAADTATASAITDRDQRYLLDLVRANQAEVQVSRLAETRASSPGVKRFAKHMIDDHTTALGKLDAIAQKKQVALSLPMEPDEEQKKMQDKLSSLSGSDFDRAYVKEAGIKAHEDTLTLLKKIQKSGHDADLKMLAEEMQPTVEAHLKMAKDMAGKK